MVFCAVGIEYRTMRGVWLVGHIDAVQLGGWWGWGFFEIPFGIGPSRSLHVTRVRFIRIAHLLFIYFIDRERHVRRRSAVRLRRYHLEKHAEGVIGLVIRSGDACHAPIVVDHTAQASMVVGR